MKDYLFCLIIMIFYINYQMNKKFSISFTFFVSWAFIHKFMQNLEAWRWKLMKPNFLASGTGWKNKGTPGQMAQITSHSALFLQEQASLRVHFTKEGTIWWHVRSSWTLATVHDAINVLSAKGTTYPFPEPDGQ